MIKTRNLTLLILLAITNGMIPILTGSTLFVWLKENGLNLQTIGLYSLANLPIAGSFIFSAILEFGAKRNFINYRIVLLASLIISSLLIFYLPSTIGKQDMLFLTCLLLSVSTTITRIILLAIQKTLFSDNKLVTIINISTIFYKVGLLIGGSLALFLSQFINWSELYHAFSYLVLIFSILIFSVTNKKILITTNETKHGLYQLIIEPFKNLFQLPSISLIILLMFFYRAPDNLITHYFDLFYLHFGLSKTNVAFGYKLYGMITASLGGVLCIRLIKNNSYTFNLQLALWLHLLSYVLVYIFSIVKAPLWVFYLCVTCEEFSRGMTMIIFWAFQTHICRKQHVLVQLALLTTIDSLSYSTLGSVAGWMIDHLGYSNFILAVLISFIPAFIILYRLKFTIYSKITT